MRKHLPWIAAVMFWSANAAAFDATPTVIAAMAAFNSGDKATAFEMLSREAAAGNSDAQVKLGYMYAVGAGVPKNPAEAFRLFSASAERGNGEGMSGVGSAYRLGSGVAPDIGMAIQWFCRGIAAGNPRALNNLGLLPARGEGVSRDIVEARRLWVQAVVRGARNAPANLGLSYLYPTASAGERAAGVMWLRQAAEAGHPKAQAKLREMGIEGAFPPPLDPNTHMWISPRGLPPGQARVCSAPIS